jgi:XTP/dITP diphosphohydrolase
MRLEKIMFQNLIKQNMIQKEIVFATGNANKIKEVDSLLGDRYHLLGLRDIGCYIDIPETADTLEGNAFLKAKYVADNFQKDCFSDDTGLEVNVLHGAPGVYSARYAGTDKDSEANMDKLLNALKDETDRSAQFRTVIVLIKRGKRYLFEGIVKGTILTERHGNEGFGYDPIFCPQGYDKTFAELSMEEKNKISHRAIAIRKLIDFLSQE